MTEYTEQEKQEMIREMNGKHHSSPSKHDHLTTKLLPHVRKLVEYWDEGGPGFKSAEKSINRIAGSKVIPYALTTDEKRDPLLLARRIACASKTKKTKGINRFSVCRSKVKKD
jgi:hypothetical protein